VGKFLGFGLTKFLGFGQRDSSCQLCESGKVAAAEAQASCDHCPAGKYQDADVYHICEDCAAGTWTLGERGATECVAGPLEPTSSPTKLPTTASPTTSVPTSSPTKPPTQFPTPFPTQFPTPQLCPGSQVMTVIPANHENCTFDIDENCGGLWFNAGGDDFEWSHGSGETLSKNTGPSSGFGGGGSYLFIETSGRVTGDGAVLQHTAVVPSNATFQFKYHMFGAAVGALHLEAAANGTDAWTEIWVESGDKGNTWQSVSATVQCGAGASVCKLRLRGVRGSGFTGDIAIENLSIRVPGFSECRSPTTSPTPFPTPFPTKAAPTVQELVTQVLVLHIESFSPVFAT
jgi:hypothetical protein